MARRIHVSWWLLATCHLIMIPCVHLEETSLKDITKNDNVTGPTAEGGDFANESSSTLPSTTVLPQHETTEAYVPTKLKARENCVCDLSSGACDINCCCDVDCTEEQSRAFTTCHEDVSSEPNLQYCTNRDIFFANRTLFEKRPVGDMFCIFVDNVVKEDVYEDPPNVTSIEAVHELIGERKIGWEVDSMKSRPLPTLGFKAGDSLFLLNQDGTKREWRLPTQLFTAACEAVEAVTYLQDQQFSCQRRIDSTEGACATELHFSAASYHSGFSILVGEGKSVPIVPYVCNTSCIGFNASLHLPYHSNSQCHNIVHKVKYRIVHAGVEGIISVAVEYELGTVSSGSEVVEQEFGTTYSWQDGGEEAWHLSGHPGYIVGLPVLAECFTESGANCGSKDRQWLTLPTPQDGACSRLGRRSPIKFGISARTGCMLSLGEKDTCPIIQQAILESLISTDNAFSHVAIMGNSNRSVLEEWVPVLEERKPEPKQVTSDDGYCRLTATGIEVYILYALTASGTDLQKKIVGVLYKYVAPKAFLASSRRPLELGFGVSFVDVSKPRVTIFAPPPTIDVRLPYDFFYPFLLDSAARHGLIHPVCILLLLVVILMTVSL